MKLRYLKLANPRPPLSSEEGIRLLDELLADLDPREIVRRVTVAEEPVKR